MTSITITLLLGASLASAGSAAAQPPANPARRGLDDSAPTAVMAPTEAVASAVRTPAEGDTQTAAQGPARSVPPVMVEEQPTCDEEPPALWGGFKVSFANDRHSLKFGFLGWARLAVLDGPRIDSGGGFSVPLVRPTLVAQLWDGRVAMRFMPEFSGASARLLDATATVKANDAFAVQMGVFRPWLSRGFRTGLPVQGLTGRGRIVDRFRINRDVGVTLRGKPWGGKFEYYLGVLNGAGINGQGWAPSPLFTARAVVAPVGAVPYTQTPYARDVGPRSEDRNAPPSAPLRVALGASAYTVALRETSTTSAGAEVRTSPRRKIGASGDVVVSRRRVFAMAEGFYEQRAAIADLNVPRFDGYGVYGQAGVLVWGPWLDVTFRSGLLSDDGQHVPIEPGVNAYIYGNHAKLQLSYRCDVSLASDAPSGCEVHTGTLQAQLLF